MDRKASGTVYVPRAAVSVAGTIQPGTLADVLTGEHWESGLAARLLLAHPPELPKRWSDRTPAPATLQRYAETVNALLALEHAPGKHGPEPVALPLAPQARAAWGEWSAAHARQTEAESGDREAAALAKLEAYAARLALVFALVDDPAADCVSADALARGTSLADWFGGEAARVYSRLSENVAQREAGGLVEWIQRQGGTATVRTLTRGPQKYRDDPEAARSALDELAAAGLGRWTYPAPGPAGGRPVALFELCGDTGHGDETPAQTIGNNGFGSVATLEPATALAPGPS